MKAKGRSRKGNNKLVRRLTIAASVIVLVAIALVLGGGSDDSGGGGGDRTLSETYTTIQNNLAISFNHPAGWVNEINEGRILAGSSESLLATMRPGGSELRMPPGESGISIAPVGPIPEIESPLEFLAAMASSPEEGVFVGRPEAITLAGADEAAKSTYNVANVNGEVYALKSNDLYLVVVIGAYDFGQDKEMLTQIVDSITFEFSIQ